MLTKNRKRNPYSGVWLETLSVHDHTLGQSQVSLPPGQWGTTRAITSHLRFV